MYDEYEFASAVKNPRDPRRLDRIQRRQRRGTQKNIAHKESIPHGFKPENLRTRRIDRKDERFSQSMTGRLRVLSRTLQTMVMDDLHDEDGGVSIRDGKLFYAIA